MKIHSIQSLTKEILIFLLISILLIFPPLFSSMGNVECPNFKQWCFPLSQLTLALIALFIFLLYHNLRKSKINIFGFRILFTIGLLFTTSLFLNFIAILIPVFNTQKSLQIALPDSFITWVFCILNFLFSAFYEEVIYRFYFTDTLESILIQINPVFEKKIFKIICEISGCLLFAFAHSYMGILSVINAAIAHFVLRYTYKKSNSILPGFISHFAYNIISLILL